MQYKLPLLTIITSLLFNACGSSDFKEVDVGGTSGSLKIIGKIEYERVQPLHNGGSTRLNFNNITTETAKQITVEAINSAGDVIASTTTDDNGAYSLTKLPENTRLKIRAYAKIFKKNKWDTKVIDNTNGGAQFVLEGSLVSTGTHSTRRNLKAPASTLQAPPFAILDSIYAAMKKVITVDSSVNFPPLNLNWSTNNIAAAGSVADGQIITSHFNGENNIYILGDQQSDTDEYDDHIIIHEWGHYFESKFSRADSIGGSHQAGDLSDIRLAFGEGWGNALSGIVTDDPLYFDTYTERGVLKGWNMNVEHADRYHPGWFSEASIQRILYDLYDSEDDEADQLSLGFKPLYDVLTGPQKTTKAFTSIFSFIDALKTNNSNERNLIENIITSESIATITDIYGSNNSPSLYQELTVGNTLTNICVDTTNGIGNKLNNHKYVYFTINNSGSKSINITRRSGASSSNPNFQLFKTSPFENILSGESNIRNSEETSYSFSEGDYLLDIYDISSSGYVCFNVKVSN